MPNTALTEITIIFPNTNNEEVEFCRNFDHLFSYLAQQASPQRAFQWKPSAPQGALPITSVQYADIECPQIVFTPLNDIDLLIGGVRILGSDTGPASGEIINSPQQGPAQITLADLADRLAKHITRIDHTGVNLPTSALPADQWQKLQRQIAKQTSLYAYPDQEWPFIIPSTATERELDIQEFVIGREPKFELVYDEWAQTPIIQFAFETNLSQSELQQLLPQAWLIPGLDHVFCSINVEHPWNALSLRFDMYYKSEEPANDWITGEWLISSGGRIRA